MYSFSQEENVFIYKYVTEESRWWRFLQAWLDPDVQIAAFISLVSFSGGFYLQPQVYLTLVTNNPSEELFSLSLSLVPESPGVVSHWFKLITVAKGTEYTVLLDLGHLPT